jgi:adenine deaminase
MNGAAYLGMDADLGSLAVGKLADLIVLDADPLVRLENTDSVSLVMKGGVLYDANDLSSRWPIERAPVSMPWSAGRVGGPMLPWHGADGDGCAHAH